MPSAGLEPALPRGKGILSPLCLPFHHDGDVVLRGEVAANELPVANLGTGDWSHTRPCPKGGNDRMVRMNRIHSLPSAPYSPPSHPVHPVHPVQDSEAFFSASDVDQDWLVGSFPPEVPMRAVDPDGPKRGRQPARRVAIRRLPVAGPRR